MNPLKTFQSTYMIKMENVKQAKKLEKISPITEHQDDIFICSSGYEERCLGIARNLSSDYKAKKVIILKHQSSKNENTKYLGELRKLLTNVGPIIEYNIDERAPFPTIVNIINQITHSITDKQKPKISIDISVFTKMHLLILAKGLNLINYFDYSRILYSEPRDYETDVFQPLSFGRKEIFSIPGFYSNYDFSKESLLILMLGYEGNRALSIFEEFDPTECILLIPDPPYNPNWKRRTQQMNAEIINLVGNVKCEKIDSRNPLLVSSQLEKILNQERYSEFNHIVSPLGTKPQALGLFLYYKKHPTDITITYGTPLKHNEKFNTIGIGNIWELPI